VAEALGQSVEQLLQKDPAAFRQAGEQIVQAGEWMGELCQQSKDGRSLAIEGHWTLVRDDAGNPQSVLSINTDITARKKADEALEMQGQVLESMAEGVVVCDEAGHIVFSNAACNAMFGYESGELLGQHFSVLKSSPPDEGRREADTLWALLQERDVREGDLVEIQRAGDVIPEVVRVFLEERPADSAPATPPAQCPACQGPLQAEGKFVYCGNLDCIAQLTGRIVHLASRRAFDIEGLGPKQVEQLVQAQLVTSVEDVFSLAKKQPQLLELERWGERSTQNLLDQIERCRTPTLARFLNGIGIRHVGETTAKDLAQHFGSLDRLAGANAEALMAVDGVGEEVAAAVVEFFASAKNRRLLAALHAAGVVPQTAEPQGAGPLSGRVFVFTGGLASMSRDDAKARVEGLGARTAGSIGKKVTDVVAGADAGSKLDKARALGLQILDETAFQALLASL
jgi:DNA ligase (NAD+)